MEFTYDGLVRHAFGFQNPNHAAALFCLLLPWLWWVAVGWRSVAARIVAGAAALALLVMLALTYRAFCIRPSWRRRVPASPSARWSTAF